MSSSTSTSAAKAAAKGLRPSAPETSSRLDAKPGRPQRAPSPVASSALRTISGSGSERTHGLRPTARVSPRALLGGPPTHLDCLNETWDSMDPSLRTRIGSITLQEAEASVARAQATTDASKARMTADACALSLAEEEYIHVIEPLHAEVASIEAEYADLSGRLRHLVSQRCSTTAEMATATRHHQRFASNIVAGSQQPPPARATPRAAAQTASVSFSVPTAPQWHHTAASAPPQLQAPAASTAPTASSAAPTVGSTMPPPPPPAATTNPRWLLGLLPVQIDARQQVFSRGHPQAHKGPGLPSWSDSPLPPHRQPHLASCRLASHLRWFWFMRTPSR